MHETFQPETEIDRDRDVESRDQNVGQDVRDETETRSNWVGLETETSRPRPHPWSLFGNARTLSLTLSHIACDKIICRFFLFPFLLLAVFSYSFSLLPYFQLRFCSYYSFFRLPLFPLPFLPIPFFPSPGYYGFSMPQGRRQSSKFGGL
jgi:hypothetical protein